MLTHSGIILPIWISLLDLPQFNLYFNLIAKIEEGNKYKTNDIENIMLISVLFVKRGGGKRIYRLPNYTNAGQNLMLLKHCTLHMKQLITHEIF